VSSWGYRSLTIGLLDSIRTELTEPRRSTPTDIQVVLTGGFPRHLWARTLPGVATPSTRS